MLSDEITLKIEKLGKRYHIYNRPQDRLKQSIMPRLQRLFGLPLQKYHREFWALHDVSFEVKKGETVGIIGRNGSGKSTLLQLICGTLTPTRGSVETKGRIAALLELGSGFNPEFTGRENVYLNGTVLGLDKEEIDQRFDDIASFADIGDFIEQPIQSYSSGMIVRLAFAVQAMVDPDILIVDEALAVGDEKFQRKCFARLEELKSKGTSILFVSHAWPQIVELCDRALLLEYGERLMYSQPLRVVRAYQKLIYAPADETGELVQEYRIADQNSQNISQPDTLELFVPTLVKDDFDTFDPNLIPETTEVYPVQGAEIQIFRILDADGKIVNILKSGVEYKFEVQGKCLLDIHKVYFGIHIRSISGIAITGQRYPEEGKFVDQILEGKRFRVVYSFKMILLPGVYFVGGGVWSYNEPNCVHRISDALMIRVVSSQSSTSTGYVDASSSLPELEIL